VQVEVRRRDSSCMCERERQICMKDLERRNMSETSEKPKRSEDSYRKGPSETDTYVRQREDKITRARESERDG